MTVTAASRNCSRRSCVEARRRRSRVIGHPSSRPDRPTLPRRAPARERRRWPARLGRYMRAGALVPAGNVLFITVDQWRGDCLSALDHPVVRTPTLDALAAGGVLFANHWANIA